MGPKAITGGGRPGSLPALPGTRDEMLGVLLAQSRMPTPPAVALQVVGAASRPDCRPADLVPMLSQDPALCSKLLKTVNSCLYGLSKPVASLERAVFILGLNPLRSLVLGLSLPAMQRGVSADPVVRGYWVGSVGGGILARELAARANRPSPGDDLVCGLLRDIGAVQMLRTFPDAFRAMLHQYPHELLDNPNEVELRVFGVTHADVGAELLRRWNLPDEVVEPIRRHHDANQTPGGVIEDRGELMYFVSLLTQLEAVAQRPKLLARFLWMANVRYRLSPQALVNFVQGVAPKIEEFAGLLDQDIGDRADYASILMAGCEQVMALSHEAARRPPDASSSGQSRAGGSAGGGSRTGSTGLSRWG